MPAHFEQKLHTVCANRGASREVPESRCQATCAPAPGLYRRQAPAMAQFAITVGLGSCVMPRHGNVILRHRNPTIVTWRRFPPHLWLLACLFKLLFSTHSAGSFLLFGSYSRRRVYLASEALSRLMVSSPTTPTRSFALTPGTYTLWCDASRSKKSALAPYSYSWTRQAAHSGHPR